MKSVSQSKTDVMEELRWEVSFPIKGVSTNITWKPTAQPAAVKESIEKALKRDAELDAENITVSADGGKVTLTGSVRRWDERRKPGLPCGAPLV